ncbi:MAG: hypothetical protein Q9161_004331 [Pseudevernia consocians]
MAVTAYRDIYQQKPPGRLKGKARKKAKAEEESAKADAAKALDLIVDVDYDKVCGDLDNDTANLQKAIRSNNAILLLIEHQKEKAKVAKNSMDHLHVQTRAGGSQDVKPADHNTTDFNDGEDDLLVEQCTKEYNERGDALQNALENNANVKQLVVGCREDLRRFHTAFTECKERSAAEIRTLEQKLAEQQQEHDLKVKATEQEHKAILTRVQQAKQGINNADLDQIHQRHKAESENIRGELMAQIKENAETFKRKLAQ